MEPIDYEKYLITNRSEIDKDPLRQIVYYPHDDIEILEIGKKFSTIEQLKPEIEYIIFISKISFELNKCFCFFKKNLK